MLVSFHHHLAIDDGRGDALGRLLDVLGAGREVVHDFERQRRTVSGSNSASSGVLKPKPLWNCTCAPPSDNPMIAFG